MLYHTTARPGGGRDSAQSRDRFVERMRTSMEQLIARVRRMIRETGTTPDLAGVGNLILTPQAQIKLVDINNVSPVDFKEGIHLDSRGYPVSDKSVEVLALLEKNFLGLSIDPRDPLFAHFLADKRMAAVRHMEKKFRLRYGERV